MWTVWPVRAPGVLVSKVTVSRPLSEPEAMGARFDAVTPAPLRRLSVMLPPFTLVWIAVRTCGLVPGAPS